MSLGAGCDGRASCQDGVLHVVATRETSLLLICAVFQDCEKLKVAPAVEDGAGNLAVVCSLLSKAPFGYECAGGFHLAYSQVN